MARPNNKNGGRPKKPIDWKEAEKLCVLQCSELEIADWFHISVDTLARRLKEERHQSFKGFFAQNNPEKVYGRIKIKGGYVRVKIFPSNFFYPMARKDGWLLEHRLIVAKRLGRCLHSWEIIHHKDHIRDHNVDSNLQLVSADKHTQITILENKIDRQSHLLEELRQQIKLVQWQNKELLESLRDRVNG